MIPAGLLRSPRRGRFLLSALAPLFFAGSACPRSTSEPTQPARAKEMTSPKELLWGPCAVGALGDIMLDNGLVLAVVTKRERSNGFAMSPGNLVDLTPLPDGEDHLNELFLYINDDFPRQARYRGADIVSQGGGDNAAVVRATGVDSKDDRIAIQTDYSLEPGSTYLKVTSKFTSTATATIRNYRIGDAVQWGRTQSMAPGHGFALAGRRVKVEWLAGIGENTSYAFVPDGQRLLDTPNGSMWSDPVGAVIDLEPNRPYEYVRYLVVGTGDTASLAPQVAKLRGDPVATIKGTVHASGVVVPDAVVRLFDDEDQLYGLANVDDLGSFAIDVLPGRYRAVATAPGRTATSGDLPDAVVDVTKDEAREISFNMGARATLAWRIESGDGRAPPVKVTVVGIEDTPTPDFGPMFRGEGAESFVQSPRGMGELPLGPGRYKVYVSRGPEYEMIEQEVTAVAGERAMVTGKMVRVVDTRGFISADLHQHSAPSFDSGVSLTDRAISNAVEGVEVLVSTDHNVVVDYRPVVAAQGLGRALVSVIGTEATTHSVGHFNALPLRYDASKLRGGMIDPEGLTPRAIFDYMRTLRVPEIDPFIQVNHPRSGKTGYFDLMRLDGKTGLASDPRFVTDFDAVEVMTFGKGQETEVAIQDWYSLLRRGLHVTATGNSDSHSIAFREVGWPRTFVCVDQDDPPHLDVKAFTESLKRGCATVSSGPFVTIESGDVSMGGLLRASRGRFEISVHVQAPKWVPTATLAISIDGVTVETADLDGREVTRHRGRHSFSCKADCFVVARVQSDAELPPVFAQRPEYEPRALAVTNPIYVDVDGNGRFDAPLAPRTEGAPP